MRIVVITGSPHKNGTTALLAEQFIKGAVEAKHEVFRFDSAFEKINPCIGCDKCETGKNDCVFKDDMFKLYPKLIEADLVVFTTPLYYHSFSAQIKVVIDRFHGIDDLLRDADKKAMLIACGASPNSWVMDGLVATYHTELRYLGWHDCGKLLAIGCYSSTDIKKTEYLNEAYQLGRKIQ